MYANYQAIFRPRDTTPDPNSAIHTAYSELLAQNNLLKKQNKLLKSRVANFKKLYKHNTNNLEKVVKNKIAKLDAKVMSKLDSSEKRNAKVLKKLKRNVNSGGDFYVCSSKKKPIKKQKYLNTNRCTVSRNSRSKL